MPHLTQWLHDDGDHYRPETPVVVLSIRKDALDRECIYVKTPDNKEHIVFPAEIRRGEEP